MKKCVVNYKNGYVCIDADRMEKEDGLIYAFNKEKLVGVFDLGWIDSIYLSETREKE